MTAKPIPTRLISSLLGRAVVILAVAGLFWWAEAHTIAGVLGRASPETALYFAPGDSRALESLADQRLQAGVRSRNFGDAEALARAAVERGATSVIGFRVLGLLSDAERNTARAEALLRYADRLSRRDLGVRLYLLERAVTRNDADEALRHYDIALRTSGNSFDILAPILSGALGDRGLMDPITRAFAADPPWLPAFLEYAIPNTPGPRNLSVVMVRSRAISAMRDNQVVLRMIERLVHDGHYREARQFLSLMRPAERGAPGVRNPRFAGADLYPPFSWAYVDGLSLGASPQPGEGGLRYFARTDQGGPVARQLLTLAPGPYRLASSATRLSRDPAGTIQWSLRCAGENGAALAMVDFPQGADGAPTRAGADFQVPGAGCAGQWLELRARAGQDQEGLEGVVQEVDIRPARPSGN